MQEWNAVISVHEKGFRKALDVFSDFGEVRRTEFFNVLLLRVNDMQEMLEALRERSVRAPDSLVFLARLVPVTRTFIFHSREEFETKARESILSWAAELTGKRFHVRVHRRGFKGRIASTDEERFLDEALLEELGKKGLQGRIEFDNPDAVIAIETVGTWAGILLWKPEELAKYPFIRV